MIKYQDENICQNIYKKCNRVFLQPNIIGVIVASCTMNKKDKQPGEKYQ
ncbi:hypothetical protein KL86DYS2_10144 [uncultured Dysgonomonas sp.]|uniref:Lipoprotein n=1 Tax=uncultured Dysgonomonas sp. TaxID=206096 RepID=A0A212IWA3_9BACT|nr:hypothetical protein KL86DYS2_10144 [uncultured Dysgonomonas sp.]